MKQSKPHIFSVLAPLIIDMILLLPGSNGTLRHAFCTLLGGVSQGPFRSLNFDPHGGDSRENILQNKLILGKALDMDPDRIFLANPVHGDQVMILDEDPTETPSRYHHLDYDAIVSPGRRGSPSES